MPKTKTVKGHEKGIGWELSTSATDRVRNQNDGSSLQKVLAKTLRQYGSNASKALATDVSSLNGGNGVAMPGYDSTLTRRFQIEDSEDNKLLVTVRIKLATGEDEFTDRHDRKVMDDIKSAVVWVAQQLGHTDLSAQIAALP